MLRRILLIARRDYTAVVLRKSFLIGLVAFPLLAGGSLLGVALMKATTGNETQRVAIVDRTGTAATAILQAAREKSAEERNRELLSRYRFEVVPPDDRDPAGQRLALADRVRHGGLFAFLEIDASRVACYTNIPTTMYPQRQWLENTINNGIRRARLARLGVDPTRFDEIFRLVPLETMTLPSRDPATGKVVEGHRSNPGEAAVPIVLMVLTALIVVFGAAPMLSAVAEDKTQRVFEMLLAAASPLELIAGKVAAAVACSLTSSVFYIAGGILALEGMALIGIAPLGLLPWFLAYVICEVTMLSSLGAALGAACSTPRDAQQLVGIVMGPIMLPVFLIIPLTQQPNGLLSTVVSLIPPFTPLVMIMRQAMPAGVPAWQPWVGLAGVVAWTAATTWAASRVFRVGLLSQGKPPKMRQLLRWVVRG